MKVEPFVPRRPISITASGADVDRADVAEMERIKVRCVMLGFHFLPGFRLIGSFLHTHCQVNA